MVAPVVVIMRKVVPALVASAALWMQGVAQTNGVLKGVVSDSTGALIPGAQVTVARERTVIRSVVSGEDGTYIVNADCTGTLFPTSGGSVALVVVDGGKEFYQMRISPSSIVVFGTTKRVSSGDNGGNQQ